MSNSTTTEQARPESAEEILERIIHDDAATQTIKRGPIYTGSPLDRLHAIDKMVAAISTIIDPSAHGDSDDLVVTEHEATTISYLASSTRVMIEALRDLITEPDPDDADAEDQAPAGQQTAQPTAGYVSPRRGMLCEFSIDGSFRMGLIKEVAPFAMLVIDEDTGAEFVVSLDDSNPLFPEGPPLATREAQREVEFQIARSKTREASAGDSGAAQ